MKMLVTGGCGFIGSNFIRYILKKYPHYQIINLDKLTYAGNIENLSDIKNSPNYELVIGDICDKELVSNLVKKVDIVVHFAAESHVDRSIFDCSNFFITNVLGTQVLLECCRINGNKRFHHISSDEVYGEAIKAKFTEKTPYYPRNPYSSSKACSDHVVRAYYHTYGLPITISHCSNNYGKYHFPEKLIPKAITSVLNNEKVPLHGDGTDIRNWIHVIDHCRAVDAIIHNGKIGETYCVGTDTDLNNIQVIKRILKIMKKDFKNNVIFVYKRIGHDTIYSLNCAKIKKELGWKPTITFDDGIKKTVEWYIKNQGWWKPLLNKSKICNTSELTVNSYVNNEERK